MKKILLLLICLIITNCNSQTQDKMTQNQRIDYLLPKVNKFSYEPLYQIEIHTLYCYKILLNGCPVYANFDKIPGTTKVNINSAILNSGEQNLEVQIFPAYNEKGLQKEFLDEQNSFSIKIERTAWNGGILEEPEQIISFELPQKDENGYDIKYSQLKEYNKVIKFNAEVPYKLEGWLNSKDLSIIDKTVLKDKILKYYNNVISAFKNKDYDLLNTLYLKADAEWYQSEYFPKDIITKFQSSKGRKGKSISTTKSEVISYEQKIFPLDDFEVKLYANNRLVRLEPKKGYGRGNSLFGYEDTDKNGFNRKTYIDLLLHLPKGSDELEIIR